jgi:glutaredoxin
MYILFYSKNCKYSIKLINILEKSGEERNFKCISVDSLEGRKFAVNNQISKVPTIIINDRKMDGVDALKWVQYNLNSKSVSSMSTRQNKTPDPSKKVSCIGGYTPQSSYESVLGSGEYSESKYSMVSQHESIITPPEDSETEKSCFVLSSDNITNGGKVISGKNDDKSNKFERDFEKLKRSREI